MDRLAKVEVILAMDAIHRNNSEVTVRHLAMSERMLNAAKALGICWGIGALCILVPVLHFFLVPTALLVGVGMAYRQFFLHYKLISGSLICPKCAKQLPVSDKPFNWPQNVKCPSCDSLVMIKLI
jgi:hypothetical protein